MKAFLGSISVAALLIASPAVAADIYGQQSLKDGAPSEAPAIGHGGFYATGLLGYAWGDRDIRQSINREAGLFADGECSYQHGKRKCSTFAERAKEPVEADFDKDGDGKLSVSEKKAYDDAVEDHKEFKQDLDATLAGYPGSSFDGKTLTLPLIGDALANSGNDDFNSFVYGAELSYLFHRGGQFGIEPAIGVTFYADGDSGISHKGAQGTFTYPSQLAGQPVSALDPQGWLGQTGYASAEREMDIDFLLRGYWFLQQNFALTAAGGVSIARAEVCGANTSDAIAKLAGNAQAQNAVAAAFNTGFCDTDTSVGPMIEAGFKWWANDRIAVVGRVDAKWHEFDANGSSSHKVNFSQSGDPAAGLYGNSSNVVEVDDTVWSAKLGVSIKFD